MAKVLELILSLLMTLAAVTKFYTFVAAEKVNKAAVGAKKKAAGTPPRKKTAMKSKKTAEKAK